MAEEYESSKKLSCGFCHSQIDFGATFYFEQGEGFRMYYNKLECAVSDGAKLDRLEEGTLKKKIDI